MALHLSRKQIPYGVVLFAVIVGSGGVMGVPTAAPAAPRQPGVEVSVATVKLSNVPIELDGIGHVQAYNTVHVMPQVAGQVVKVAFSEGKPVHVGDLLVEIDPRIYEAKLEQDQADLAKDTAHRDNAQLNLTRYQDLAKSDAIAAQTVDSQASRFAQEQATLLADKAQIDQDRIALGYTRITAPIDGIAGFRQVDVGNLVAPGGTQALLTITQVQPIAVLFTLSQDNLPAIQAHSSAGPLTVEAWSQDGAALLDTGTLEAPDNTVNPTSGTITLKAVFPNPGNRLWPGQFVEARLIVARRPHAATIPLVAVERGPSGTFVWVVGRDHTVRTRAVRIAQTAHGVALVDAGLKWGEQVVTNGQYGLRPGARVTPSTNPSLLKNTQAGTLGIVP